MYVFIVIVIFIVLFIFCFSKTSKIEAVNVPNAIHLTEDINASMVQPDEVKKLIRDMESRGFFKGKAYSIDEIQGLTLWSLFDYSQCIVAVIYSKPNLGIWFDICVTYQDGFDLTVTNAPAGEEMDTIPKSLKIFDKKASFFQLYELMQDKLESKPRMRVDDRVFKEYFEDNYNKAMEWRNRRGGTTKQEIMRVAANMGERYVNFTDKAYNATKKSELRKLEKECICEILNKSCGEHNDFNKYFVVLRNFDLKEHLNYLLEYVTIGGLEKEYISNQIEKYQDCFELYADLEQRIAQDQRPKKIGSVLTPVEAAVYRL